MKSWYYLAELKKNIRRRLTILFTEADAEFC